MPLPKNVPDCYKLLQVAHDATTKQIKKAYRKMALVMHPDKNPNDPTAGDKFGELVTAYEILIDENLRGEFDEKRTKGQQKKEAMKKHRAKQDAQDTTRKAAREDLERRERDAQSRWDEIRRKGKAQTDATRVDSFKDKIAAQLAEFHRVIQQEADEAHRARQAKMAAHQAVLDQPKQNVIKVKWSSSSKPFSQRDLDVIFSKYGDVEQIIVRKNTALISFMDDQSAMDAVEDVELDDDFGLSVKLVSKDKAKKANAKQDDFAALWHSLRPEDISFADYERETLERLDQAARKQISASDPGAGDAMEES